ncbi:MAG: hypothetical protein QM706_18035 [Nitrospira sp.]
MPKLHALAKIFDHLVERERELLKFPATTVKFRLGFQITIADSLHKSNQRLHRA